MAGLSVQPLRYGWLWLAAGCAALALVLTLALVPMATRMPPLLSDKVAHGLVFAFLMTWFLGIFEPRLAPRVALMLVAYGVLIELLQGLTPYRVVEAADVVADCAGIGIGWLLAQAGLRHWAGRVEALLGVRSDGR